MSVFHHGLGLLLLAFQLLLGVEVSASVLVEVKIERVLLVEIVISLRNWMAIVFYLLNLVQMFL